MPAEETNAPQPEKDRDSGAKEQAQKEPSSSKASAAGDPGQDGHENDETTEPAGAALIREEVLDNAGRTDAEKRALDADLSWFGFPTNQQINFLSGADVVAVPERVPLSAQTLTRVRTAFIFSKDYTPVREQVLRSHFMLLGGRAGSGRECLATHILDALCDSQVDHLDGGRLKDLDPATLAPDAGYLWTNVDLPLEPAHADQLIEALRHADAKLILVWPDGADLPFHLEDFRYTLDNPLDLSLVLERHLQPDDEVPRPETADLLAKAEVADAIALLGGVGEAARLGRALRDTLAGKCTVQIALSKGADTANWFARLPAREDKAFALALASLDGLSYPAVVAGARRMDEIIKEAEDPDYRWSIRTSARPARELLAAVDADCRPGVAHTSYGEIPMTAVASNRQEFPRAMLRTLWHEFPYLQQLYLDWLVELVEGRDPDTRGRAAMATGVLALGDFEFIRGRVLDGWARHKKREVRRSAAVALRAAAQDETLKDVVWGLLDDWATTDGFDRSGRHLLQLTAATALGGPVGATDYSRALDMITSRLLDWSPGQYQYPLWGAVTIAMVELFGDGSSQQSSSVLERLIAWAGDKRTGPRDVAVAATVAITTQPPMTGYQDGRQSVPLLRAVAVDPENLGRTADLLRLAINDRVMAQTSVDALLRLAENVEEGDESTMMRLVQAVPQTPREHRTLRYEFRRRTSTNPHPPIFDRLSGLLEGKA